ncbi:hypothetical protein CEXT_530041 [Caerostris extrusa]|uniref:Uncharacterized protein n=1 Tax=Caerostris extrusa TaxID=172846 RepID=A0AAV4QAN5_CAEEX|nr:hypothetical protein CEXT_530041 [Caerostris extrusa]
MVTQTPLNLRFCVQVAQPNEVLYNSEMPEPSSETIRARQDGSFENIFLFNRLFERSPPYEKREAPHA